MNIFDVDSFKLSDELITVLHEKENIRIERIVSTGQTTHWLDQSEDEFVLLLKGNAKIEFESGGILELCEGDTLLIEKYTRHKVRFTSANPPCVWLCIFFK